MRQVWDIEVWLPTDIDYKSRPLSLALKSEGVRVALFDLPVIRRKYMNPRGLFRIVRRSLHTIWALKTSPCRIVFINTAALGHLAPIARILRKEVTVHLHESLGGRQEKYLALSIAAAHRVIAVSQAVRNDLPRATAKKTEVVYNGFNIAARPAHAKIIRPTRFLFASRWNAWKGHKLLIEAWDLMRDDESELWILGGAPSAGVGIDVPALVGNIQRCNTVRIVGEIADISSHLDSCDVVVVPSQLPDPLPTVAIEALAAGRPVLAAASGGLPEIVDARTGWLLPVGSTAAEWAKGLDRAARDVRMQSFAGHCRERFDTNFTQEIYATKMRSLLEHATKKVSA